MPNHEIGTWAQPFERRAANTCKRSGQSRWPGDSAIGCDSGIRSWADVRANGRSTRPACFSLHKKGLESWVKL